jgi:hypothetical protein
MDDVEAVIVDKDVVEGKKEPQRRQAQRRSA